MVNIIIDSNQLHAFMGETWHCDELLYWSLEGEGRGMEILICFNLY